VDYARFDAVLCGGRDVATCYRHAVTRLADSDPAKPVHWVAEGWEFCAGTLPAPSGISGGEILVFNHFQHFFGVKDSLQFRIEILRGAERTYFYRILQADESLLVELSRHVPDFSQPVCISVHVSHPILTRGRHFRYRVCADLHWRQSFTTLHSAHEYFISPDYQFKFRLPRASFRDGEMVLTLPNYALDMGATRDVQIYSGGAPMRETMRTPSAHLEEVRTPLAEIGDKSIGWTYRGYGGSFWFALESGKGLGSGYPGSIAGNHHQSVSIADRPPMTVDPTEVAWYRRMAQSGFMVKPHAVPLSTPDLPFRFGFEFDGANPPFDQFNVHYFDGEGTLLGEAPFVKTTPGPVFDDALLATWDDPARDRARLAIVMPDWAAGKVGHKGLKKMSNLLVEMRATGDRDFTELQDCWRNCGVMVEGLPHFTGLPATVFGRTNLFGRARCDARYRTGIVAIHGAGWLGHRGTADVEIVIRNLKGEAIAGTAQVPAFCWKVLWLDEVLPAAVAHLADGGIGPVLVQSPNADLNCMLLTTNRDGAISLQHLWGY
jgi:hypothetical protein